MDVQTQTVAETLPVNKGRCIQLTSQLWLDDDDVYFAYKVQL